MEENRVLRKEGVFDYDYVEDTLFFKVKDRDYSHSIELLDYVIDIDSEGFVSGLQIFDAAELFALDKNSLRAVRQWKLEASLRDGVLEVKIVFESLFRNKLVEKNPILVQRVNEDLPNSTVFCSV